MLIPSVEFLAPSIQVEWRSKDRHVRRPPRDISKRCHYQGFVHGDDQSRVALSACNGLVRIDYLGHFSSKCSVFLKNVLLRNDNVICDLSKVRK